MQETIIIGSRGSDLALWQAHFLQKELLREGYRSEIKIIKTQGDKIQHISLEKLEGKGFFTKEIEDALLEGTIDVAVHSHKDLPTVATPGLTIAAVSHRENPSELLLIRKDKVDLLQEFQLATNAIVGTSSSRRYVQLQFFRPDIRFADIRGNVPTRINKLRNGDYDAILLAFAGVHRLQLDISDLHAVQLAPQKLIPSPAQGVLAFQCRLQDEKMLAILSKIHHADVADTIFVERKIMNLFNGGCHMPLGVYCYANNKQFHVWAAQATDKVTSLKRVYATGNNPAELAAHVFQQLQHQAHRTVFITSPIDDNSWHVQLLQAKGFQVNGKSCVHIQSAPFVYSDTSDWIFFTSKNGVTHFFEQIQDISPKIKFAAIGEATARQIHFYGHSADFIGEGSIEQIATQFKSIASGASITFAVAEKRQTTLQHLISDYANTNVIITYTNSPVPIAQVDADIIVFTSPLNAEGFLINNSIQPQTTVIAIGATTQQYLAERGINGVIIPPQHSLFSVAELLGGMF